MVGIACPVTKYAKILGYVVGSILGQLLPILFPFPALISDFSPTAVILLIVLFIKIKAKVADRRAASETHNCDSEEEEVELMFDDEKDGAVSDSDPSEVSVLVVCSNKWSSPRFTRTLLSTAEK